MHNDLILLLEEDHAVLKDLVIRALSARDFRKKQQLTNDLYLSLNEHMAVIEKSVLPMLRVASGHFLPDSFLSHFEQLRALLSDLMAHRLEMAGLDAALVVLCPTLNLQAERERLFLLPALEQALKADQQHLGAQEFGEATRQKWHQGMAYRPWASMPSMV